MGIGNKIKELRTQSGLTQKDLADKLHVTYQAVSRWENDEVEPSIETLKEMTVVFNCSMDELFGTSKKEETPTPEPVAEQVVEPTPAPVVEEPKVVEKVIVQEVKPVLAVCERCNKPIYESRDINRITKIKHVHSGRTSHAVEQKIVLCPKCNKERLDEEKRAQEAKLNAERYERASRRTHSFVWPTIAGLIGIITGIVYFTQGNSTYGVYGIVGGVMIFTFIACLILDNNFIGEMWCTIAGKGIKLPGVIFTLDLDGILFLIFVKILGAVLSLFVSIFMFIFATLLGMALSVFVYPFALGKNIKGIE